MYVFCSKLAVHGRIADLRCLRVACTKPNHFVLSSVLQTTSNQRFACFFVVMRQGFEEYTLHLRRRSVGLHGDFPTCKPRWRRTTSASTVKGTHSQGARRERQRHSVILSHVIMFLMNLTICSMEECDSRQVNSSMRYFAHSFGQHSELIAV